MAHTMTPLALAAAKQQLRDGTRDRLRSVSPESVAAQSHRVFQALRAFGPYRAARTVSLFLSMPGGEIQTDAIVRDALAAGKSVFVPYLHRGPVGSAGRAQDEEGAPPPPGRVMDMVQLRDDADYGSLVRDRWGIPSIDPATVRERRRVLGEGEGQGAREAAAEGEGGGVTLDLVLLPGLAFDVEETGVGGPAPAIRRLGHGRGFYDYFVHRYLLRLAEDARSGSGPESGSERPPRTPLLYGLALREQLLEGLPGGQIPVGPTDQGLHGLIVGDGTILSS